MKSEYIEAKLNTDLISENEDYTNKKVKRIFVLVSILSLIAISLLIYFSLSKKILIKKKVK